MNEAISLSLQGKQLTVFVNIEFSNENSSFGKFVSASVSLTASPDLKDF